MITAIAIDDEPLALTIIKTFCSKVDSIELKQTFTETAEAYKYLEENQVDLLFLDISMPSMSGLDFYRSVGGNMMVIFTTAFSEYAVEGFNLSALDYLLKPFSFIRFRQAVEKAEEYFNFLNQKSQSPSQFLFIRADYSLVKIEVSDIQYIEGLDNYLKIHLSSGKPVVARMSMKAMGEKLPANEFLRVHRSFIVPVNNISSVRNKTIFLSEQEIPIGTNYIEAVNKWAKSNNM